MIYRSIINRRTTLLVGFMLSFLSGSVLATNNTKQSSKDIKFKIEQYLNKLEEKRFSGSVLIEYQGELLHSEGYGVADREQNIAYMPDTISDMGSVTKQFTAAAILKLEMQGKLSVLDTLDKFFDKIPKDKTKISIHQLLTHSSGLHLYSGDDFEPVTEDEFVKNVFAQNLLFTPGSKWEYSNPGYSILALLVERLSGNSYEQYLYLNLFKPSGMEQTGYTRPDYQDAKRAIGYRHNDIWGKPNEMGWDKNAPYWHLKGNGGLLSTAEDFYKWHKALLDNKILSDETKKKYFKPHLLTSQKSNENYGYGWFIKETPRNTKLIHHNGGNGIIFSDFYRYIDEKVTIIIFSNSYVTYTRDIADEISSIIFDPYYIPKEKHAYKPLTELVDNALQDKQIIALIKSELNKTSPSDYMMSEQDVNRLGYTLLGHENIDGALAVFKFNTELNPKSANVYDSYGETLISIGQVEDGVTAYKKALALDPKYGNEDAAKAVIAKYTKQ